MRDIAILLAAAALGACTESRHDAATNVAADRAPSGADVAPAAVAAAPATDDEPRPNLPPQRADEPSRATRAVVIRGFPAADGALVRVQCDMKGPDPIVQNATAKGGRIAFWTYDGRPWWWRVYPPTQDGAAPRPRRAVLCPRTTPETWTVATGPGDRTEFVVPLRADGAIEIDWASLVDD